MIKRIATVITPNLAIAMDIFTWVSRPVRLRYSKQTKTLKSIKAGVNAHLELFLGGIYKPYALIFFQLNADPLTKIFSCDHTPEASLEWLTLAWEFSVDVVAELAIREMPEVYAPPHSAIGLLNRNQQEALVYVPKHRALCGCWALACFFLFGSVLRGAVDLFEFVNRNIGHAI